MGNTRGESDYEKDATRTQKVSINKQPDYLERIRRGKPIMRLPEWSGNASDVDRSGTGLASSFSSSLAVDILGVKNVSRDFR